MKKYRKIFAIRPASQKKVKIETLKKLFRYIFHWNHRQMFLEITSIQKQNEGKTIDLKFGFKETDMAS